MRRSRSAPTGSSSFDVVTPSWDFATSDFTGCSDDVGTVVEHNDELLYSFAKTVFHYRGNVTPPKDYQQWAMSIRTLVGTGSIDTASVKSRSGSSWIEEFLEFCEAAKVPVDFVTTHHYPTDALGHEDDDTETQLANRRRGILRQWTQDTRRRAGQRPVYYTEWNSSSNPRDPRHDEPYAAAFVAKTALKASDLVQGYSFWTFSDIFEENYFPSVPFHGGFGLLNLHGIAKPTYRAFELLHQLGNERLLVDGLHETVNAWVTRENARITVLLVNHALSRHAIMNQRVRVHLANAPEPSSAWVERIDEHHANAKCRWQALGAPEYLAGATLEQLHEASRVRRLRGRGATGGSIWSSTSPHTPSLPSPSS